MIARTTASPWDSLIDTSSFPQLPEALQTPTAVLLAVSDACDTIAIHNRFHFLRYAQTAEELARNVPGLSTDAAATLLFHMNEAVVHGCYSDEAEAIEDGTHAAIDALCSRAVPELPYGAIDPRGIAAGLNPRPATPLDALSHDDSPQVGWPMVTWKGEEYSTPNADELEEWCHYRPDGEFVGTGHPDSWGVLLAQLPSDPEVMP